ncbi:hypothetical protein F4X73_00620 [Candidatus Poribacteria bacterium]|nr:hypothetical protein [Candidatus Poribacteria bacterium]
MFKGLMKSFHTIAQILTLKTASLIYLPIFLIFAVFAGCTNNEDFANPFDSDNLRTAGAPELELYAGDKQVRVTWIDTEQEGIKAYKIYRRSISNSDEPFALIATVDAPANEYIDTDNIENDRLDEFGRPLAYEYRMSHIDTNDVETPDPTNPPDPNQEPFRHWQTATVKPSIAPPVPVVTLGEPVDLTVNLFWSDYEFPNDFDTFRVYAAIDDGNTEHPVFNQIAEIERDELGYADTNFREDGITKLYRVAAVDIFGVEGITTISATSPNLPPAPPVNVSVVYIPRSLFNNKYDATISWTANTEPDLAGYQIYTEDAEGNLYTRGTANRFETEITFPGEDPPPGGEAPVRTYYISAYDNTPGPDGERDHSEIVMAQ